MNLSLPPIVPITKKEIQDLGWEELDVLLITGDSYVDHPSFGIAIIARMLLHSGYRVAILARPPYPNQTMGMTKEDVLKAYREFGTPKLFIGISSGVVDSMVNNYTAQKKVRNDDEYAPVGDLSRRPDRASEVYAALAKEAFPESIIVGGGVECSFRRLAHYDYWDHSLKKSILATAPYDYILYGMGENSVLLLAEALASGKREEIKKLRGVAYLASYEDSRLVEPRRTLPSFKECKEDKKKFLKSALFTLEESNPYSGKALVQGVGDNQFVVINPPSIPLKQEELDKIYDLPYTRKAHPAYTAPIPALRTVEASVTVNRGCFGGCTFCAITLHQGKFVQSRSANSILNEVKVVASDSEFTGTITDLGGPTANMYGLDCGHFESKEKCKRPSCLYPSICPNLITDHKDQIDLLEKASKIKGVKHLYIASGVRYDLALKDEKYLKVLVSEYVGGRMKVAPEHMDDEVLALMGKPSFSVFEEFLKKFEAISKLADKEQFVVPYFISSFPSSTLDKMQKIESYLKSKKWQVKQIQDFIPLPMTLASVYYYTGLNMRGESIYVAKKEDDRYKQRTTLQYHLKKDDLKRRR